MFRIVGKYFPFSHSHCELYKLERKLEEPLRAGSLRVCWGGGGRGRDVGGSRSFKGDALIRAIHYYDNAMQVFHYIYGYYIQFNIAQIMVKQLNHKIVLVIPHFQIPI